MTNGVIRRVLHIGNDTDGQVTPAVALLLCLRPHLGIRYSSFAFDLGSTFAPSILGRPRFRLCPQIFKFYQLTTISSARWRTFLVSPGAYAPDLIFYSLDGQPIFAPPRPPWGKNRSPNLPLSFPGIVGVYGPSFSELVIVVWPPNDNSHTYKHTIILL